MRHPHRAPRRLLLLPALLLGLVMAGSVPAAAAAPYMVPADYQTGEIGHYDFNDYTIGDHESAVDCHYHHFSNGKYRLTRFVFRAPRIWWFDQDGDTTHEHGTVGWQVRIQQSSDPISVPFTTVYTSSVQKRTAHEDHPAFSEGDQATFTTRQRDWTSHQDVSYRVKYTITWYKSNGDAQGTLSHWYSYYDSNFGGQISPTCANQYFET